MSVTADPTNIQPRAALIQMYLREQTGYDRVRDLANEIKGINPDFAQAYLYLGIVEERTGNPEKAIALYKTAIEKSPRYYEAYFFLANLYDDLGNKDRRYLNLALTTYGKVLYLNPGHLDAMLNMGLTYVKLGKLIEAQEMWKRVLQYDPDHPEARTNLDRLTLDLLKKGSD